MRGKSILRFCDCLKSAEAYDSSQSQFMSTDRTFITNEDGQNLYERFRVLLGNNTKHFDCLIGYFYISGFYKLYPALTQTEKIRILIGIKF